MRRAVRVRFTGIFWVYAFAAIGLTLVVVSLMGNIVGSFTAEGEIDQFTLGNYPEVFGDEELPAGAAPDPSSSASAVLPFYCFSRSRSRGWSPRSPIFPGRGGCSRC